MKSHLTYNVMKAVNMSAIVNSIKAIEGQSIKKSIPRASVRRSNRHCRFRARCRTHIIIVAVITGGGRGGDLNRHVQW